MPGRRPKPTALHRLQGTYHTGKHRDRVNEPIAEGELGKAPSDLTPAQQDIWRYAIRHAPPGVLMMIDAEMLLSWVIYIERRDRLQAILEIDYGASDWENSAAHRNLDRVQTILIRLAAELGFSPAARPRLRAEGKPQSAPDAADPWQLLKLVPGGKTD